MKRIDGVHVALNDESVAATLTASVAQLRERLKGRVLTDIQAIHAWAPDQRKAIWRLDVWTEDR